LQNIDQTEHVNTPLTKTLKWNQRHLHSFHSQGNPRVNK